MTNHTIAKALPIQQKAFAVIANMTWPEYLAELPQEVRQLLQMRLAEVHLTAEQQEYFLNYPEILNLVVVVTDDAPETIWVIPIIVHITARSPRFSLYIVRDSDDLSLLENIVDELDFEDNDLDLPLLLFFDEEWNYQTQWGPQPETAEPILDDWLEKNPAYESLAESDDADDQDTYWKLTDALLSEMRMWYNSGLSQDCIQEIHQVLINLQEEEEGD